MSAQFVEPQELRALREGMDEQFALMLAAEVSLMLALRDIERARQRLAIGCAWVKAVDIQVGQEARR